mmetsp:Transcript_7788/g.14682  ORF Transcript_7788/g.14682 Transcript_7788/m.14682 type:complete len:278 (+) Transcript_7788:515-1348(+)
MQSVDGRQVATCSIWVPSQLSGLELSSYVQDGGKQVVIDISEDSTYLEPEIMSGFMEAELGTVLGEMWNKYCIIKRVNCGKKVLVFDIPFEAEEEFYMGLFPSDVNGQSQGFVVKEVEKENGQGGLMITFAVIEKPRKEHKVRTPVSKGAKLSYREMMEMKFQKERARQAFMHQWEEQNQSAGGGRNTHQRQQQTRNHNQHSWTRNQEQQQSFPRTTGAAAAEGRAEAAQFFMNNSRHQNNASRADRVRRLDEIPLVGDDDMHAYEEGHDASADDDL